MVSFEFEDAKFKSIIVPSDILSTLIYKPLKNSLKLGSLVKTWFPSFSKKLLSQKFSLGLFSLNLSAGAIFWATYGFPEVSISVRLICSALGIKSSISNNNSPSSCPESITSSTDNEPLEK